MRESPKGCAATGCHRQLCCRHPAGLIGLKIRTERRTRNHFTARIVINADRFTRFATRLLIIKTLIMTEADLIIEPRRGKKEKLLPPRALLVVNPSEAEYAVKAFNTFIGQTRSLYQHTKLLVDKDRSMCLAGPALGAAAAALILEKLIVLGVKEIWLVSCCGTLDPSLSFGDLVLAIGGVSGEGVSRYYSRESVTFPGRKATNNLQEIATQQCGDVRAGIIWSTDAPYRERRSELIALQERYGVVGVDMEFSALCAVAAHRGVSLGALFVVSDMIWTKNWKPGFGSADFDKSSQDLIDKLITRGLSKELGT